MSDKNKYVHENHNGQEIRNVSHEVMTTGVIAALVGADLYEGRIVHNSTTGHMNIYAGGLWYEVANTSDLNDFEKVRDTFDASGGATPDGVTATQIGSGVDNLGVALGTAASLQKGDRWVISTAGTIVGIQGDDVLAIGDIIMCLVDGSTTATDWIGINQNIDENLLGGKVTNFAGSTVMDAGD